MNDSKQMSLKGNGGILHAKYSVLIIHRECMSKLSWYIGNVKELDQTFFVFLQKVLELSTDICLTVTFKFS